MRQNLTLRKFILFSSFVLVIFGCATSSRQTKPNIAVNAEAVEQGITLAFNNIPPETTRLFIAFTNSGKIGDITGTHDIISTNADIRDSSLEQVKNTGRVLLPYVKPGQKYDIAAVLEIKGKEHWVYTHCTPYSGIYYKDGISLNLNKNNTGVTLSAEPVFSAKVQYAPQKYSYVASIEAGEGAAIGYGDNEVNALTWNFANMPEELKDHLSSGNYPAYIRAFCNIIYDNLSWMIEIAKSEVFAVSL